MLISMAGLGLIGVGLGTLDQFAAQIKRVEGYFPPGTPGFPNGSLAYQNNNPGNIRYTSYYASNFGQTVGAGGYGKFRDYNTGWAALKHQITLDANRGLTIRKMMEKYAPSQDGNDPASYAATIAQALGVSVDTPVSAVISDTPVVPIPANPAALVGPDVELGYSDFFGSTVALGGVEVPMPALLLGGAILLAAAWTATR